jgi:hypothetical protein
VSVTLVPSAKRFVQTCALVHVAPGGVTRTVPGATVTIVRAYEGTKCAVTSCAESTVTLQLPVPVHAPVQPMKTFVPIGSALRYTVAPRANLLTQRPGQAIPGDVLNTRPGPMTCTVSGPASALICCRIVFWFGAASKHGFLQPGWPWNSVAAPHR